MAWRALQLAPGAGALLVPLVQALIYPLRLSCSAQQSSEESMLSRVGQTPKNWSAAASKHAMRPPTRLMS